jgi:uncharacterized OsmC-like protein
MTVGEKIKVAFERSEKALSVRPSLGKGTGTSIARIKNGLTCEIEEGPWKMLADMPEQVGGNMAGPTPGVYGRAALGSCLAIGYMMRAARFNVLIKSLEVEVQGDYDDGALFGTIDLPPGYVQVRYIVTIESDSPEDRILSLLDDADKHSPYLDVFSRGQDCTRQVRIISLKHSS